MKESTPESCPRCGAPLLSGSDDELCPACLLSGALKEPEPEPESEGGDETIPMQPGQTRPSPRPGTGSAAAAAPAPIEEPSDFPCDFGDYRLLGLLGRGGMGAVFEAEETATGRRLALKMLSTHLDNPEMRQRFLREGRLAASVSHPNSLYIYGTEEIEDIPVITMELAAGGTLSDRLRKEGPLPVKEAVDGILDVIAGLEAAFEGGVLHRDVKPSNCFVSPDGSVKVGDFGLSVSTTAQVDSFMTATGVIMGTPAYAPPEQLRGRDLDVRADIYSVGATLFTLLTGKPPIEGKNAVEIVAAALDEKPPSLTKLRGEIPAGLAQVVARCLAKKPDQRFSGYRELRNALLPFSSAQPEPAPLGRRILAGLIDVSVVSTIPVTLLLILFGINAETESVLIDRTPAQVGTFVGLTIFSILYYTLCEGIWGAGIGKALMGFRVVRVNGQPAGLSRAFGRIAIGTALGSVGEVVGLTAFTAESYEELGYLLTLSLGLLFVLAFVTMRRRNGFATVWDLATGTRVVVKPKGAERPAVEVGAEPELDLEKATRIGSFPVVEEIVPGEWVAAHDPTLRRWVWLRRRMGAELADARRDVARPGRNRWLQSVETDGECWDVFEAPAGVPLRTLADENGQLPWASMRHWLHDFAAEIASAARDGTLPPQLGIDHVWITAGGRAVLLDEPYPVAGEPAEILPVGDLAGQQRFLSSLASRVNPVTVPLHARPVLQSLAAGSFEKLSFLAGNLRSLLTKPASLDRQFRAATLFAFQLFIPAIFVATVFGYITRGGLLEDTEIDLWTAIEQYDTAEIFMHVMGGTDLNARRPGSDDTPLMAAAGEGHGVAVEILLDHGAEIDLRNNDGWTALHVAAFFGRDETTGTLLSYGADPDVTDTEGRTPLDLVSEPWDESIEAFYREAGEKLGTDLDLERIRAARPKVAWRLRDPGSRISTPTEADEWLPVLSLPFVAMVILGFFFGFALSQLIALLAVRGTFGQFVFGFAVVDAEGAPAGRVRLFVRWLVAWAIPLLVIVAVDETIEESAFQTGLPFLIAVAAVWSVGLLAFAVARPTRGLHDQLTGCWLVRR